MRAKVFKAIDESRVLDGERFLVWSAAWNYPSEKELFSAYPEVVQLDCMHGVTSSTDGFNAVGIDGNGHNIKIMRAFIASQDVKDSKVFHWLFLCAFSALVPSCKDIRVFFTDGCQAMISELEAACGIGQQYQFAQMFRCLFHLITKSFDDQFGIAADGWQTEVKKLLYGLRKCETDEEFEACSEFVLRKIAGMPMLGQPQSALRAQVLRFVKRRSTGGLVESVDKAEDIYAEKLRRAREDTAAVQDGTATEDQTRRVLLMRQTKQGYADLARYCWANDNLDPTYYSFVPDLYKTGWKARQLQNDVLSERTQSKIEARRLAALKLGLGDNILTQPCVQDISHATSGVHE
jgi:hypothetical protein